ncbi:MULTISPECIES: D-aminoacyl-tRNA deacylase [Exiguobacterium]|uniref:D-aminoacyl-tRNA deacylase n=1 Tax=Exiguobacterium chiriqhucha RW-2 TaxID=1345023 RepID=U1N0S7_9BACL|nr:MULTISPECIES: D-aminoacyl-tRNA deacylase [Exiguobacterium]ERG66280.1 D-tyrosyl-tRNA(Tyr) deacylase [Exiguobacterium chiriqhucha RW-2]KAB2861975.1 MAG: D-tyrosyl-tRNA(Tyr) deacylase [Exiguobacterium chiriqhucha]MCT4776619.1 D-aminoacyl-tRNA deacylase [Exiguobacterium aquaticum]MCT4788110.1 D-aminoacyl-tRNA deacylase [Exiguobacterium mexicanum]TCI73699.1 D-tyrosyl-tRNA(Tyr) deacylase [Exiguobacterium sp. IPCI3]
MRVLLQRVKEASVTVDEETIGQIEAGYLLLVGVTHEDTETEVNWLADKVAGLRVFEDADEKMNLSIQDVAGKVLSVSQFTLYGDTLKGRRPAFTQAAKPDIAERLYEKFNERLRTHGLVVETGKFGAMMDVALVNDGPVTLMLEKNA